MPAPRLLMSVFLHTPAQQQGEILALTHAVQPLQRAVLSYMLGTPCSTVLHVGYPFPDRLTVESSRST
jgi:hypothetical protein